MKTLTLLFILIPFILLAQNQEEQFIQQLVKDKYISESEAKRVSPDSAFISLYDIYLARRGWKRGNRKHGASWSYVRNENYITRLKLFVKHLREFDIIDKKTCGDLYRKIIHSEAFHLANEKSHSYNSKGLIETEYDIMQYTYEWQCMQKNRATIHSYIKTLKELGLMEDASKIKADEINSKIDLLQHFKKHLYIAGDEFPKDICEAYQYAYKKLESLHPDFVISELKCEERHVVEDDYEHDQVALSFKHKKRSFNEAFYYNKDKSESSAYGGPVSNQILFVFNLTLINSDSPYRALNLQHLKNGDFAVVFVNKAQSEFLKFDYKSSTNNHSFFAPDFYKPQIRLYKEFDYLKRDSIQRDLLVFDRLNFYKGMSQEAKDSLFNDLLNSYIESTEDLFYSSCRNNIYFDWEMWPLDTPYITATKEFASITSGDFNPTNIKDNFSIKNKYCDYEFTFKGKRYAKRLEVGGDWFDPEFLNLIEQAIEENDLPGKFYDLPDGGQASGHVYLSPVQYQYLVKYKVIEFWTDPFED